MSFLLKLLWAILLLCIILVLAVTVGITLYGDEIEQKVSQRIEQAIGRELRIDGEMGFKFNPSPSFYATDIHLANASWSAEPSMLTIEQAEFSLSFVGLAQGKMQVSAIKLKSPYMLIERENNNLNWFFNKQKGGTPKPLEKIAKHVLLHQAEVENFQIDIRTLSRPQLIVFDNITAEVDPEKQTIEVVGRGEANDRPINAKGTLTDVQTMLLREPSQLELSGTFGDMQVQVQGAAKDVLRWQGLDFQVSTIAPSLDFFQPWNKVKLPPTPPIEATGRFLQPKRWNSAHIEDINAVMRGYGGETRLKGSFDQLRNWSGLQLSGTSKHKVKPLLSTINWTGKNDADISGEFTLSGAIREGLTLNVKQATLQGQGLRASASGNIDNLSAANTTGIQIQAQAASVDKVGDLVGRPWPQTEQINATASLQKVDGRYSLVDIFAENSQQQSLGQGDFFNLGRNAVGQFKIDSQFNKQQITAFNQQNRRKLPEVQKATVKADIAYENNKFTASEVQLVLEQDDLSVSGQGDVKNLKELKLEGFTIDVDAPTISSINKLYAINLPQLGHLRGSGRLSGSLSDNYQLSNINGNFKSNSHNIDINGKINNLGPDMVAEIGAAVSANSFADFQKLVPLDLPKQLGASGTLRLTSAKASDWSVQDININLRSPDQGKITGAVRHFPNATAYNLQVDLQQVAANKFAQIADISALKNRSLSLKSSVSTLAGGKAFTVRDINLRIDDSRAGANVIVGGQIKDIAKFSGVDLKVNMQARDFAKLAETKDLGLKDDLKLDTSFNLQRALPNDDMTFVINRLQLAESDLSGTLSYRSDFTQDRSESAKTKRVPSVKGKLNSRKLDLLSLTKTSKRKRLFSDDPISFEWAKAFNADVILIVNDFNGLISNLKDMQSQIKIENGLFSIPGAKGLVGNGELTVWFLLDTTTAPYSMVTSIAGKGLDSQALNLFGDSGLIRRGLIDTDIGVSGQGASLAQMMSRAYGKFQLQLINASLKNENLELFGSDLLLGFLSAINPLAKQAKYLDIECGVINFPISNGKASADQGIAIKTDRVTVLGGGQVNLKNESLKVLIKPKARKGFGLSAGTIANLIEIGGTIGEPKIQMDSSGLLGTATSIGAAVASGGWTLLAQGLIDRNKANSDVCKETLNTPVSAAANPATNNSTFSSESGSQK